jgi:hypothetical protein
MMSGHPLVKHDERTGAICKLYSRQGKCRGTGFLGKTKGSEW